MIRRLLPLRNRRTRKRRSLQAKETRRLKCLRPAKLKMMVTVFCALQPFKENQRGHLKVRRHKLFRRIILC